MAKKNELEEQIEKVDAALTMLEGQMNEPKGTKDKIKGFFSRFVPMSKKTGDNMQVQFTELSYSILVVQKQFLQFVNAVNGSKKMKCEKEYKSEGRGMYE